MSQSLYRKYRSRSLAEILGQDHIVQILQKAIENHKISHAYLLNGPRGTGKTSVARILAYQINNLPYDDKNSHQDIIEIDAASHTGVDDVRTLRENAQVVPMSAKYKVYIIDEVHMLSKSAFNALLKTLEEPPQHVIFILGTTDVEKLPNTILSRVQQYFFHPIADPIIAKHLIDIAKKEDFTLEQEAADLIAKWSNGGFRDAISLLDQLSNLVNQDKILTHKIVEEHMGLSSQQIIEQVLDNYLVDDFGANLAIIQELEKTGGEVSTFTKQLLFAAKDRLAKDVSYARLIDQLLEVLDSQYPILKLIAVLANADSQSSRQPIITNIKPPAPAEKSQEIATKTPPTPAQKPIQKPKEEPQPDKNPAPKPANPSKSTTTSQTFDWQKILSEIKKDSMTIFGILSNCQADFQGDQLILWFKHALQIKQINDGKKLPILMKYIQKVADIKPEIIVKQGTKPSENKTIEAVAEILGDVEEINLEDN